MKKAFRLLLVAYLLLFPPLAFAAPCCGAHAALPSLLSGYEFYRINAALLHSVEIGRAEGAQAVFHRGKDQAVSNNFNLSGSFLATDRLQFGLSAPFSFTANKMGDLDLISAYEIVTNEGVEPLKPKVYLFTQATLPTGNSSDNIQGSQINEINGLGFYRASFGAVSMTTYRKWDVYGVARGTYTFEREFEGANPTREQLGLSADLSLGLGYSVTGEWRIGGSVQSSFAEGRKVFDEVTQMSSRQRSSIIWPAQLQVTWFKDEHSSLSLSYLDETLLGPVKNVSMSRSVALQYSYRRGGS